MKTLNSFQMPGRFLTTGLAVSGAARVVGQKTARDRHASKWGVARVQLIQVPAADVPTAVPTLNVALSAHERGT
ncbi:hypothetical protein [Actinosynnema sp. NPDC023587]|uniref:hypothetical protein n=1 Tax=Actinosynnema sp. NPDC023587 TaxID=3154695 RepID=UPI003405B921